MITPKRNIGNIGEKLAAKYLKRLHCRVLAKNCQCGKNELDLVVRDGDYIAFVEVKTLTFESEEEAALYAEYNDALVTQRNLSMTEYAVEALESGQELFICVGAAHVVGEGAMAELLREMGYTVELVR